MKHYHVEDDPEAFPPAQRYRVRHWPGIAVWVDGWETEPDEDTEWSGIENRTGRILVVMVGDDRRHVIDREDLIPIDDSEYCGGCGQIGCAHG